MGVSSADNRLVSRALVGWLVALSVFPAAPGAMPQPIVSARGEHVTLGLARSACWSEPTSTPGESRGTCADLPEKTRPDGALRLSRRREVRIDMGEPAAWVRLGAVSARRLDDTGRLWRAVLPRARRVQRRDMRVRAGFAGQPEPSYLFGPVRLIWR